MDTGIYYNPYYGDNFYYVVYVDTNGNYSANSSPTTSNSFFDPDKNTFFNSKAVLKLINSLIEIGISSEDMYIITELMFANRIKKFHHFFNNLGIPNTIKSTHLFLPYTYELFDVYDAHIGDKYFSKPVYLFFKFFFNVYNNKLFDFRQIENFLSGQSIDDISKFADLVSKCKNTDLCRFVFKKIDMDVYFQNYFQNVNTSNNNKNNEFNVPVKAY